MKDEIKGLAEQLESSAHVVVVTGAGVSAASGIRTFRGSEPDAVWRQSDVSLATVDYFDRDPVGQWRWYLDRFKAVDSAEPNPAHLALAELEEWQVGGGGEFVLVTQNIDTLHERAGSRRLIKVHGTADRLRCSRTGCAHGAPRGSIARSEVDLGPFLEEPVLENLPHCPDCGSVLRAHVLFFDEYYAEHEDYRFAEVEELAQTADTMLFVGTSFAVGVTDLFLQCAALRSVPAYSVDPASARTWGPVAILPHRAEELLPPLVDRLRS